MKPMETSAAFRVCESSLDAALARLDLHHPAGEARVLHLRAGQILRIVDIEGNQAADTLFYAAADPSEHYSASDTLLARGGIYLTTGSVLMSSEGRPMLRIIADTCGRHDTLGGACAAESNSVRYALAKKHMHSCRDSWLAAIQAEDIGIAKCDLLPNINFFMNVPVTPAGGLRFEDGVSAPGKYVELEALMDVIALVSNCPQLNNPCNGWNPTPIRLLVWDPPAGG